MTFSKNYLFQNSILLGSALIISSLAVYILIKNISSVNAATPCVVTIFGKQYDVSTLGTTHSGPKGTTQIDFGGNTFFQCGGDMTALYQGMHGTSVSRIASLLTTPSPTISPMAPLTVSPTLSPSPSPSVTPSVSPSTTPSIIKHHNDLDDELEGEMDDDHDDDRNDDHGDRDEDHKDDHDARSSSNRHESYSENQSSNSLQMEDSGRRHDD